MKTLITLTVPLLLLGGCTQNKITGRRQASLLPESQMQQMAISQYQQFLSENRVINSGANAEMVKRVGRRLATAITNYYSSQGMAKEMEGFQWEYNLVDSKEVNAWCMPGGKIVVYSGLLPITQNEDALAVVVGHEIAHALAKHGSERASQQLLQQFGGAALSAALANKSPQTQNIFMNAYGIGSNVGALLPFSRKQETEADKFGLRYAAMAGYDPRTAIPLWERMEKASSGQKPPEFLSTHPAEQTRIVALQKEMPEAMKYYQPAKKGK